MSGTSRTLVFLFTDVVDSAGIKSRLGDRLAAELFERHNQIVSAALDSTPGGTVRNYTGDGYLVTFDTVSIAVAFALQLQAALQVEPWGGCPICIRIGVHMGECLEIGADSQTGRAHLSGMAVDLAARVMSLAAGGQILLSQPVFDNARQYLRDHPCTTPSRSLQLTWIAHGPYLLRGHEDPVEIFEVGTEGSAAFAAPAENEKARRIVAPDDEPLLGWRPAVGLNIPRRHNWVLDRQLGEGGFGEVWLATHCQTKRTRVFKFCFDSTKLRSLRREFLLFQVLRDQLGDRADISTIHEVQLDTPPYFLESEFTDQGDLISWLKGNSPAVSPAPLRIRLGIVERIAEALAAAHSVGVLHKDLKPANVLMSCRPDGTWQPILSDFGIGSCESLQSGAATAVSVTSMLTAVMGGTTTGVYAPPEVLAGQQFTTAGDVYALGVMLYQIVCNDFARPLGAGWERDIADPLLLEDIASCIDVDPARRDSAAELARRLHRIDERRRTRWRQRFGRLTAASSLALLVLLTAGAFLFQHERGLRLGAQEARDEAEAARRDAESARQTSEDSAQKKQAVIDFLADTLSARDPNRPIKRVENFSDVLDYARDTLIAGHRLKLDPDSEATISEVVGNTYLSIGNLVEADNLLHRALEIRESRSGAASPEWTQCRYLIATLRRDQGRLSESANILRDVTERSLALLGESDEQTISTRLMLALVLRHQGYVEEPLAITETLAELAPHFATTRPELAGRIQSSHAVSLHQAGRTDEALALLRPICNRLRTESGEYKALYLTQSHRLAEMLLDANQLEEAMATADETLAERKIHFADLSHPRVLSTQHLKALILRRQGNYDEAIGLMADERMRRDESDYLPDNSGECLVAIWDYAMTCAMADRDQEADAAIEEAHRRVNSPELDSEWDEIIRATHLVRTGECRLTQQQVQAARETLIRGYYELQRLVGHSNLFTVHAMIAILRFSEETGIALREEAECRSKLANIPWTATKDGAPLGVTVDP